MACRLCHKQDSYNPRSVNPSNQSLYCPSSDRLYGVSLLYSRVTSKFLT